MKESQFQTFAREWKEDIIEDGVAYDHKKMLSEWKAYVQSDAPSETKRTNTRTDKVSEMDVSKMDRWILLGY